MSRVNELVAGGGGRGRVVSSAGSWQRGTSSGSCLVVSRRASCLVPCRLQHLRKGSGKFSFSSHSSRPAAGCMRVCVRNCVCVCAACVSVCVCVFNGKNYEHTLQKFQLQIWNWKSRKTKSKRSQLQIDRVSWSWKWKRRRGVQVNCQGVEESRSLRVEESSCWGIQESRSRLDT